jgi:hypothetical protein|uniref:Transmembrane protein 98 n=1 Tax=Panagrolaimus sp. PS1159 TaxID=55785 RepID=A0AC35FYA3_9BILA
MDFVVYLAIAVLCVVFIISLLILIFMCRRKYEYNRLLVNQSLRFSKLRHDNVDDIIQLSPHISNALNSNQWVYDVSGILEHCVAVLKLCHTLTDKLAKIPLNSISPQLNDVICQATARVVPRFDDLLQSMAAPNVDVRLIEARVVALCCSCWSLVSPFYLMNPKYKEVFGQLINDMEAHQKCLQLAVEQATINATAGASGTATSSSGGNGNSENGPPQASSSSSSSTTKTPTDQRKIILNETSQSSPQAKGAKANPSSQIISGSNNQLPHTVNNHRRTPPEQKRIINSVAQPITVSTTRTPPISLHQAPPPIIRNVRSASVSLHPTRDESRQELLDHEAPADPSA